MSPIFSKILIKIGSFGPIGYLPASGSVAVAVIGIPLFAWMSTWSTEAYAVTTVTLVLIAVWIHHVGDRYLGEKDSRILVWDELAGFAVAVFGLPFTWPMAIAAFVIERTLDILKVPPANWIERRVPGGWGVVGDDLIAGFYTLFLLRILGFWFPTWLD